MQNDNIPGDDAPPNIPPDHVVVLGAGPAGLAAAHELSARGVRVTVLEAAPRVGGLSLTTERNGFKFDLGGHRWFTKKDWLNHWFTTLMQDKLVTVNRVSRIYFDGKYFDYPISIGNVFRTVGVFTSLYAGISYVWSVVRGMLFPGEITNIEQAYKSQFGSKLYQMFFKRYTEKVWGRDCSLLSADWVTQRTKGLSIWETVRNALVPQKMRPRDQKVESLIDTFLYPRDGYQEISEQMRTNIESVGGRVLLRSKVCQVSVTEAGPIIGYEDAESGSIRQIECDHMISTIPLPVLVRILEPKAPMEVIDAAKRLEFRGVITANIMIDKEQVTPDTWLYIHDDSIGFARIHEPGNWSPGMVPSGKTSICAEWFCTFDDEIWRLPDEEIVARTVGHLSDDLGFIQRDEVIDGFVVRARTAYPVYSLEYNDCVGLLKDFVRSFEESISIAGRGGTFRYNNADHSIETGLLVAQNLLGYHHDVDSVNTEQEYHEEKSIDR